MVFPRAFLHDGLGEHTACLCKLTSTYRTTKLNPKRWPTTLLTTALFALHFLPSLAMHTH